MGEVSGINLSLTRAECQNCGIYLGEWKLSQMVDNSTHFWHVSPSNKKLGFSGAYYLSLRNGTATAFCPNCIHDAVADVKDRIRAEEDPLYDYFNVNYRQRYLEEVRKRKALEREIKKRADK